MAHQSGLVGGSIQAFTKRLMLFVDYSLGFRACAFVACGSRPTKILRRRLVRKGVAEAGSAEYYCWAQGGTRGYQRLAEPPPETTRQQTRSAPARREEEEKPRSDATLGVAALRIA
jgi:hypothetical protein